MALFDDAQELQNPPMAVDALFCEEESFEEDLGENEETNEIAKKPHHHHDEDDERLVVLENDLFWEDDELGNLIAKEEQAWFGFDSDCGDLSSDGPLLAARKEAVRWIFTVKAHYGFSALTTVLAVNYFDRFVSSLQFQRDKPWMSQLAAVACLSLAAKVEETHVPLLLDLQVEESRFVFEAKTIKRMELLVLSTLKWRMHPVTPISFFSHIVRRLGLKTHLHWEFLLRCERLLLSLMTDSKFLCYLPSVLATATMLHVINEIEPYKPVEYQDQLLSALKINEDTVSECYKLMVGTSGGHGWFQRQSYKRKHVSVPGSPNGVIDASFSSYTSNDSCAVASSTASSLSLSPSVAWSPGPRFKRSRAQDQKMRLPPINGVSVDVLTSPR